jgi:glycosyltransferase involved in cell wall biosynthesis
VTDQYKLLSVVIPTRNRADFLATALASIIDQDLAPDQFEVLVIDNGSTDRTKEVVDQVRSQLTNVRYFYESEPGLHVGRHRGLKEANADQLVYADDDIRAEPTWLSAIAENFADPKVAMVGGNNYPDFKGPVPSWLEKMWAVPLQGGQMLGQLSILSMPDGQRAISPMLIWGCNFSIRKQVLLDAGGFHPDAMPGDLIHFRGDGETHVSRYVQEHKLGCKFDSRASVYHAVTPERMTIKYFRQRAFNQGISDSYSALRLSPGELIATSDSSFDVRKSLRRLIGYFMPPYDAELRNLNVALKEGYQEGYGYHQKLYAEDPKVKAWVHQPNYL